jgi:Xaa-Pro aminopeptidase
MTKALGGFRPETFARRREEVRRGLEDGILILSSSPQRFSSRDTEYPYRPDSELFYLTGCKEPSVVAVLREGEGGDPLTLFVPGRDPKVELWSGPRLGPEEAKERFSADAVYPLEALGAKLPELLKEARRVFFRLGVDPELDTMVVQALHRARGRGARTGRGPRGVEDPGQLLDPLRMRKDEEEIRLIRRAAQITVEGFREAMAGCRAGIGEWEVESTLEAAFRRRGATGPAFPTIVGSGPNGCVLHYSENTRTLQEGELVLVDGGAEADLYAGDVSRTFPSEGSFTPDQRALYEVVLAAHQGAISKVRPGNTVAQVHEAALQRLTGGLVELGVLSGDVEGLIRTKAYEPYFPHQTSHWLGLDVHDVGDYAEKGFSQLLEPGMVLTVEPGLYFSPGQNHPSTPFSGMGIRIEDDLLVTADGWENLTESLPVTPEGVEALVNSA